MALHLHTNGWILFTCLVLHTTSLEHTAYQRILKIIKKNKHLIEGDFYPAKTKLTDLNPGEVNCIYSAKGVQKYTKCSKDATCFQLYSTIYNNGQLDGKQLYQGCWMNEFYKKIKINCSSKFCGIKSDYSKHKSTHSFCCCSSSLCNLQSKTRYIHKPLTPVKKSDESSSSDAFDKSTLVLTIITTSVTFVFVIVCLIVSYYWRQKQPKVNLKSSSLTKTLYNDDNKLLNSENHQVISYQVLNDILHGNIIHQGCRSAVRLGTYEGNTVAIKVVPPSGRKQWYNEQHVYTLLNPHINIAEFVTSDILHQGYCFEGIIVMKYYEQGSLLNYIRQHTLSLTHLLKLAYSITNGLAYLHGEGSQQKGSSMSLHAGVAHRDLNTRNILIKANGTCVLADFGYATDLSQRPHSETFQMIGSPRYMAPEVLEGLPIGSDWSSQLKQLDSYSLGLILWELCRRSTIFNKDSIVTEAKLPFQEELGNQPSLQKVRHCVYVKKIRPVIHQENNENEFVHSTLKMTMQECWDHEGRARLTASCVLNRLQDVHQTLFPNDIPINKLIELPPSQTEDEMLIKEHELNARKYSNDNVYTTEEYYELELLNGCSV